MIENRNTCFCAQQEPVRIMAQYDLAQCETSGRTQSSSSTAQLPKLQSPQSQRSRPCPLNRRKSWCSALFLTFLLTSLQSRAVEARGGKGGGGGGGGARAGAGAAGGAAVGGGAIVGARYGGSYGSGSGLRVGVATVVILGVGGGYYGMRLRYNTTCGTFEDECSLYNASVANTTAAAAAAAATTVDPLTLTALPTTPSLTNPNDPIFVSFDNYNDNLEAKHNVYMDNCTYTRLNAGGPGCNPDNAVLPLRTGLTLLHAAWTLTLGLLLSLLSLFW